MGRTMIVATGARTGIAAELNDRGWPVAGVFVGGCVERGVGSSFRASAHTHWTGRFASWICVRSARRVLTETGQPSRLLLHEIAHVLAPKASHGSRRFVAALASVGIQTDTYSRAGRTRAGRERLRAERVVIVHDHLSGEPCVAACGPYDAATEQRRRAERLAAQR
jgi:hypothetical protein